MNALITNIINNVFHGIWFYCILLEPKYSRRRSVATLAGTTLFFQAVVLAMRYFLADMPYGGTGIMLRYLAGYFLATFIFGGVYIFCLSASHPVKSLFLVSAYLSFWTLLYITISIVTRTTSGAGTLEIWLLRIGLNIFFMALYYGMFRKRLLRVYQGVRSGYGTVAAISLMAFVIMTLLIIYNDNMKNRDNLYLVILILLCGFMASVYILLFLFIARSDQAYHLKQMQFHEKFLMAQIDSYEEMKQSMKRTRHDFRHHNLVVAEYARNRDYQGILNYLQEYDDREMETYANIFCENHAVNNVVSSYVDRAEQNHIEVDTDIRLGELKEISDYDLVSIFANILENALIACTKTEHERWIHIFAEQKGKKLVLACENTCTGEVIFEDGLPRNRERDGVGVESILNSARQYGGNVDFSVSEGVFTCRVILNNFRLKG